MKRFIFLTFGVLLCGLTLSTSNISADINFSSQNEGDDTIAFEAGSLFKKASDQERVGDDVGKQESHSNCISGGVLELNPTGFFPSNGPLGISYLFFTQPSISYGSVAPGMETLCQFPLFGQSTATLPTGYIITGTITVVVNNFHGYTSGNFVTLKVMVGNCIINQAATTQSRGLVSPPGFSIFTIPVVLDLRECTCQKCVPLYIVVTGTHFTGTSTSVDLNSVESNFVYTIMKPSKDCPKCPVPCCNSFR